MIRLFTALCKSIFEIIVDADIFQEKTNGFRHYDKACPNCGATGKLSPCGKYSRWLMSYTNGHITSKLIQPLRFACTSCGKTHALLPDILIPYSSYGLRFKLNLLIAYFERKNTVVQICENFNIAVSTLYEWKKLMQTHKELLLGVLISQKEPALAFLRGLFESSCLSELLKSFFNTHSFSFMQSQPISTTRSHSP